MKLLLSACLLLQAASLNAASPSDVLAQVCYTDINMCAVIGIDRDRAWLTSIMLSQADYDRVIKRDPKAAQEFLSESGVLVRGFPKEHYDKIANGLPTVRVLLQSDVYVLENISPEAWELIKSGSGCAAGIATCVGGVEATMGTCGLAFWSMKLACGYTGIKCADTIRSYGLWKKTNKQVRDEDLSDSKPDNGGGGTTSGGGGDTGGTSSGGGQGGWYGPGGSVPGQGGHGGIITIFEN